MTRPPYPPGRFPCDLAHPAQDVYHPEGHDPLPGLVVVPDAHYWSDQSQWVADSSTPEGGRFQRIPWHARVAELEAELRQARAWRDLLMDLDRNENGRHEGDADVGDPSGVSQGNPLLRPGQVIGYTIGGRERPIVMPAREDRHDPAAWTPRP